MARGTALLRGRMLVICFILPIASTQPLESAARTCRKLVTNMKEMFHGAIRRSFNQPLEKWNVSNVTNINESDVSDAKSFISRLRSGTCSKVTNMSWMFYCP